MLESRLVDKLERFDPHEIKSLRTLDRICLHNLNRYDPTSTNGMSKVAVFRPREQTLEEKQAQEQSAHEEAMKAKEEKRAARSASSGPLSIHRNWSSSFGKELKPKRAAALRAATQAQLESESSRDA